MNQQTFKCTACDAKIVRTVKKRKAWHGTFCSIYNRYVRAKSVRPV
jgi:hypothetical protein